jgi:valyl-tRNA synthetase
LIGKRCVVPFSDPPRSIPIIGDEYVDIDFGTVRISHPPHLASLHAHTGLTFLFYILRAR